MIEAGLLDDKAANYLAAVARNQGNWGLAYPTCRRVSWPRPSWAGDDSRPMLLAELARIGRPKSWPRQKTWN